MTAFLYDFGLFLAKAVTIVIALGIVFGMIAAQSRRAKPATEQLEVKSLNDRYERLAQTVQQAVMPKRDWKKYRKTLKQKHKERTRAGGDRQRLFVIDFHGDIRASAVATLREEVTAVLSVVREGDEVLVRLDNSGGLVHEHGLAASQLARFRDRGVALTVAVDKVAASGGYLMAAVADRIIAAPFAIVGSIGVLAQMPNFHRWLNEHGVEFEQFKAGEFKRTVTMFGENTEADRAKMLEQIEQTHGLFKDYVLRYRPALDLNRIATGEYWYGTQALELGLVDAIKTSDDYLLQASEDSDLYQTRYRIRHGLARRLSTTMQAAIDRFAFGGR